MASSPAWAEWTFLVLSAPPCSLAPTGGQELGSTRSSQNVLTCPCNRRYPRPGLPSHGCREQGLLHFPRGASLHRGRALQALPGPLPTLRTPPCSVLGHEDASFPDLPHAQTPMAPGPAHGSSRPAPKVRMWLSKSNMFSPRHSPHSGLLEKKEHFVVQSGFQDFCISR